MRHLIMLGALATATALALPAHAGWYVHQHGTRDSLTWSDTDGRALELESPKGKGIEIARIAPAGRGGLQQGDVITAVDGHAVTHVADLLTYANAHLPDAAKLSVHRGHGELEVALPPGELAALVHPHP
ncbi:MAG: PDZ domain-containing protein [Rhodanobacter sp.]